VLNLIKIKLEFDCFAYLNHSHPTKYSFKTESAIKNNFLLYLLKLFAFLVSYKFNPTLCFVVIKEQNLRIVSEIFKRTARSGKFAFTIRLF